MTIPSDAECGYLHVGYMRNNGKNVFTLLRILDGDKNTLAENDEECSQNKFICTLEGKWVRRGSPVNTDDPSLFWRTIKSENPFLHKTRKTKVNDKTSMTMVGVVFPEEYSLRKKQDGWVFLMRHLQKVNKNHQEHNALVRPVYAGRVDMAHRVPFFDLLQQKKIAVFGAGCLGAPSILEFARCGVGEIRMLDHDFFDPGTAVRWPFGMDAAGQLKVVHLAKFIRKNYPYTKARDVVHRLGITSLAAKKENTDLAVLRDILKDVDMIYDATTELGLQHLLSDLAAAQKIPYVGISTTQGAWGGIVIRISPQSTAGCWGCYRHFFAKNKKMRPPADESGFVQPKGCGDVTYVGAGFDAQQIALEGVRAAVSTLTQDNEGGYPALPWDLSVLHLRDGDGSPIPPTWATFKIDPHPDCRCAND